MTDKQKLSAARRGEILEKVTAKISPYVRLPLPTDQAAAQAGVPEKELREALDFLRRAGKLTKDLDRRISLQRFLDDGLCRPANLVSAPLLSAAEIRAGELLPPVGRRRNRPFVTLTIPRELGHDVVWFCSFIVPDNVMMPLHIARGDAVVCAIGLPPRDGAPVLCVLPGTREVCVRCFFRTDNILQELGDPERKHVDVFAFSARNICVVGPVISVQRFIPTWRRPADEPNPEPPV